MSKEETVKRESDNKVKARELRSGDRLKPGDRVWTVYLQDHGAGLQAAEEVDVVAPTERVARKFVQQLLDEHVYAPHLRVGQVVERPTGPGWVSLW